MKMPVIIPASKSACAPITASLEVETNYKLDQPAAGIVRCRNVLVSRTVRQLAKRCTTVGATRNSGRRSGELCRISRRRTTHKEVLVVDGVQELATQFQIHPFREVESLDDACIDPDKARSMQNE